MKTYTCFTIAGGYDRRQWNVAAVSFFEAWKKMKAIMRKRRCRYRILSLTETAVLDG